LSERDHINRDVDLVMLPDLLAEELPFNLASRMVSAMQALLGASKLFDDRAMHIDSKTLADASHTRAIVCSYPYSIPDHGYVDGAGLHHALGL
jgi:hypothetical protein